MMISLAGTIAPMAPARLDIVESWMIKKGCTNEPRTADQSRYADHRWVGLSHNALAAQWALFVEQAQDHSPGRADRRAVDVDQRPDWRAHAGVDFQPGQSAWHLAFPGHAD